MYFYKFNISDYLSHTAHLSEIEDLAYRRMLDWYYLHEKPLPKDVDLIAKNIRMRSYNECITNVLREFFIDTENGFENNRANSEIITYCEKSEKAKASIKSRWDKNKNKNKELPDCTNVLRTKYERNTKQETLNTKQETLNTKKNIIIPDGININAWSEWIEFRKSKRKPVSKIAANKQFKMLLKYDLKTQQEIINNSITSDYQGLFEPRGKNENSTRNNGEYIDNSAAGRVRAEVEKRREGRRNLANDGEHVRTQVGVELRTED